MRGFSLIEVMVALAILGVMLVSLFQIQASSIRLATEARNISLAVGFAKMKLLDCEYEVTKNGFSVANFTQQGNFSEFGYPNMSWSCHAYAFRPPSPNIDALSKKLSGAQNKVKEVGGNTSAAMLTPFFTMITNVLGDSVRELVTIVKIGDDSENSEIRLVTHLIDRKPMLALGQGLDLGLGQLGGGQALTTPGTGGNAIPPTGR